MNSHLIENKRRVDQSGLLLLIRDDAADEVWLGGVEHGHEGGKRLPVYGGDRHE